MARPCCSIEMEPRTLNQGQLTHAREAAVDIVHKNEQKEASTIFMEGLKPVDPVKEVVWIVKKEDTLGRKLVIECEEKTQLIEPPCKCLCSSAILESPEKVELIKEPLSAPF
ncbi:hypothetical protein Acr_19g0010120 [Actinidia rufa]|uniref:Uncharacterized protein n=1 Tax=Actinidia rufa TaxID=165716 RepID=A0A7J0GB81_9ERIC|nr:hypothetical protein Acr_19g0010120 [Actinidia rufa]